MLNTEEECNALVVQVRAVARGQVNDVRPHPTARGAIRPSVLHQSEEQNQT